MSGVVDNLLISTSGGYYKQVFQKVVELIFSNTALTLFLFGGLVAMCWRHFRSAKRAVR